jgi:DNA mismatch endonuclease Vsr
MERLLKDTLKGGKFLDVSPEHSRRMAAVRHKGNRSTEKRFRAALIRYGIRGWELHPAALDGRPDFFFAGQKLAVFLDGCFWHGCDRCGHIPKKNNLYWQTKISRNKERDKIKTEKLTESGIQVLRFWEHEVQTSLSECLEKLALHL